MTERFSGCVRLVLVLAALSAAHAAAASEPAAPAMSPAPGVPQSLLLKFLGDRSAFTLIDARSPEEYAASHIDGAVNVPHDRLETHVDRLPASLDEPIVIYCRTGKRAGKLQAALTARGYTDVRVLGPGQIFSSGDLMTFNCGVPAKDESPAVKESAAADAREEKPR